MTTSTLKKFDWAPKTKGICVLLILIGALSFIIGLQTSPQRAWANYLSDYFFWLNIGLSGIFFVALQYSAGARWSVSIRRIPEAFIAYLPVALILFIILLFGVHYLYEWTHHDALAHDPLLQEKSLYLNLPFFVIRHLLLFVLWFIGGRWMVKNSLKQDEKADPQLTVLNIKISAPFLILFAILYTLASVDLVMSLSPHWFSTIFGIYCWAGLFYSGLAMIALWTIQLKKRGFLNDYVNENHLHDLGKLMFAFLVFWGYIAFSQYMLIWYANLPEETPYMIIRTQGAFKPVAIALMLFKFVIPLFLLVSRPAKRNEKWLMVMALWFLAAQWLDIYWMVFPTFFKEPVFGLMEIGIFLGFAGLFILSVGSYFKKVSPVPVNDPGIQESLHLHQ